MQTTKEEIRIAVDDSIEKSLNENEGVEKMIKDKVTKVLHDSDSDDVVDAVRAARSDLHKDQQVVTTEKLKDEVKKLVQQEMPPTGMINAETVEKLKEDIMRDLTQVTTDANSNAGQAPESKWETAIKEQVNKAIHQKAEVGKRENNVILYRVKEKTELNEAKVSDRLTLVELLNTCSVTEGMDAVADYKRIGTKADGTDRPILLKFKELEAKVRMWKNLRNLSNAETHLKIISVNHDMSIEEREVTKNLVAEAKRREAANPGYRYRVRGPPGNQRIAQLPLVGARA